MAFTGVVALATAETVTAVMVFTAVAEVGIALTVMGMVTGDKNMTQTGAMMSAVGGVGTGLLSASGTTAATAASETAASSVAGEAAADAAALSAAEATAAGAGSAAPAANAVSAGAIPGEALSNGAGSIEAMAPNAAAPVADSAAAGATTMPTAAPIDTMPVGTGSTVSNGVADSTWVNDVGSAFDPMAEAAKASGKTSSDSFFSGVGKVWNGLGAQGQAGAIQLVGGAFKGANDREMFDEQMDLKNRELALRSYGNTVASYKKSQGIINSAKA